MGGRSARSRGALFVRADKKERDFSGKATAANKGARHENEVSRGRGYDRARCDDGCLYGRHRTDIGRPLRGRRVASGVPYFVTVRMLVSAFALRGAKDAGSA